jgi:hypothetical protein
MGNQSKYTQKFNFIRDNVFLIAEIDLDKNKQYLILEQKYPLIDGTELIDRLECIHTVINQNRFDKLKNLSNEKREEIKETTDQWVIDSQNLNLNEKWFALKSWVQGIAETGMDALQLQGDIDVRTSYWQGDIEKIVEYNLPIAQFLFRNLIKIDLSFLPEYLRKIEKDCQFEGVYHKPSLRANLEIMFKAIDEVYIDSVKEIEPIIIKTLLRIAEIDGDFLFHYGEILDYEEDSFPSRVRAILEERKEFVGFPEYHILIDEKRRSLLNFLAENDDEPTDITKRSTQKNQKKSTISKEQIKKSQK